MATNYLERLQIPEGFEEMLHDLLKEILREQPKSINYFYTQQKFKRITQRRYEKRGRIISKTCINIRQSRRYTKIRNSYRIYGWYER